MPLAFHGHEVWHSALSYLPHCKSEHSWFVSAKTQTCKFKSLLKVFTSLLASKKWLKDPLSLYYLLPHQFRPKLTRFTQPTFSTGFKSPVLDFILDHIRTAQPTITGKRLRKQLSISILILNHQLPARASRAAGLHMH